MTSGIKYLSKISVMYVSKKIEIASFAKSKHESNYVSCADMIISKHFAGFHTQLPLAWLHIKNIQASLAINL